VTKSAAVLKGAIAHPLTSVFVPDSALGLLPSIALSSGQAVASLVERIETGKVTIDEAWQMRSDSVAPYTTGLAAKRFESAARSEEVCS
jgi:hypothetical protein